MQKLTLEPPPELPPRPEHKLESPSADPGVRPRRPERAASKPPSSRRAKLQPDPGLQLVLRLEALAKPGERPGLPPRPSAKPGLPPERPKSTKPKRELLPRP